jgi:hypothetical protein
MKKWIIGSFVGAIIVFLWQACSWMFLGIHESEVKYTPAQEQIMSALANGLPEDGKYFIPNAPPGTAEKDKQEMMKKMAGKPWAWITYVHSYATDMTTPMIFGFITDLVLVILLISILVRGGLPNFVGIFTGSIAVGVFAFLWGPYSEHNWFQVPWSGIQGQLIDAIGAWALCGLWLGWWLRRPVKVVKT